MQVTVIICTYNRSESLKRTLAEFVRLKPEPGLNWELIVVDNNSADGTRSVCETFADQLPLRYVFEPCQGLSAARNRGVAEARGSLLLFTDDDVDVDSDWVASYWRVAQRVPQAGFFGGKVIPKWERPPPAWLEANCKTMLRGVALDFDLGDEERLVTDPLTPFVGANFAMHKTLFNEPGVTFRTDLGANGKQTMIGEETFLIRQLMARGVPGFYVPTAVVHHRNSPERMTERYVRRWYKAWGVADVRLGLVDLATQHRLWGVPRWWWRKILESLIAYGLTRWTRPSQVWLNHEQKFARRWGNICELRAQARLPRS